MRILLGVIGGTLLGAAAGLVFGWLVSFLMPPDDEVGGLGPIILLWLGASAGAVLGLILGGGLASRKADDPRRGDDT